MRDNEKFQHPSDPLAQAWEVLSFQHLKVLETIIPTDQNKKHANKGIMPFYLFNLEIQNTRVQR
jgi:hypothetical protein